MKYAFVSDIHANLQAWQAVWRDRVTRGVDTVICLGDIVGYGPRPAETLAAIRATVVNVLMGNHDAAVSGMFDASLFNHEAREMVEWTDDELGTRPLEYLRNLPYVAEIEAGEFSFACAHGSMYQPEQFLYIFSERDARNCWASCETPLVFVGHTHLPRVDVLDRQGECRVRLPNSFEVEPHQRYIVNVGSVGMPRVGDIKACYCTFDTDTRLVEWHHVDYDIDAYKREIVTMMGNCESADRLMAVFTAEKEPPENEPDILVPPRQLPKTGTLGL